MWHSIQTPQHRRSAPRERLPGYSVVSCDFSRSVIIVAAIWKLAVKVVVSLVLSNTLDLTDIAEFQSVFGMVFTVIIALEFKRSLLVVAHRQESIVQVRTVILIALLAIVRKLMILDLASTESSQLFALAAAILALGAVHWLVRDQDRSIEHDNPAKLRKLPRKRSGSDETRRE